MKNRNFAYLPDGTPKFVRCYDDEKTADRYTVVFGKRRFDGVFHYVGMSENPFSPMGIGLHGSRYDAVDRPTYGHLGKKITFAKLPEQCRQLVAADYAEFWGAFSAQTEPAEKLKTSA